MAKINAALVDGESNRAIARRFELARDAVRRHRIGGHLSRALTPIEKELRAAVAPVLERKLGDALDLWEQVETVLARLRGLMDAVDQELRDPDDPTKYFLGPRAEQLEVVYMRGETMRKASLADLLTELHLKLGIAVGPVIDQRPDPLYRLLAIAKALTLGLKLLDRLLRDLGPGDEDEDQVDMKGKTEDELREIAAGRYPAGTRPAASGPDTGRG